MILNLKNKTIIIAIISFALGVLIYNYSQIIFQEGNPWPQIKGIFKLNFGNKDIIKLDIGENKYISKSDNPEIIKSFMKSRGYDFTEQMGSGYLFVKNNLNKVIVTHKYYSRFYSLWSITENIKNEEDNLSNELRGCLPKSDMTSRETCNKLLATIINFEDCVRAGFSIMKSNPPKCATPDGRIFIQAN